MISLRYGIQKKKVKLIKTEGTVVVTRGWGVGEMEVVVVF